MDFVFWRFFIPLPPDGVYTYGSLVICIDKAMDIVMNMGNFIEEYQGCAPIVDHYCMFLCDIIILFFFCCP